MLARPCFAAAEQLCGEGTLIYPDGKTQPGANFAHPGANFRGVGSAGQAGRGVYAKMPPRLSDEERAAAMDEPITGGHVDGWDGDRWRVSVNTTLVRPDTAQSICAPRDPLRRTMWSPAAAHFQSGRARTC